MPNTSPVLHFDFHPGGSLPAGAESASSSARPLTFRDPVEIISADRLEDVAPALARVEAATSAGRWAAGFVSYEAAPALDAALRTKESGPLPLLWFGIFERPLEHEDKRPPSRFELGEWTPDVEGSEYRRSIGAVREAIRDGSVYQVNYTLRMRADFSGDPLALHERLRAAQGMSYSAFLDLGRFSILSASPELFFERRGSTVTCRPMKGTARRGRWQEEDEEASRDLLASEKDRAENAMIVDLVRNDLGRISEFGSVRAHDVFRVETYRTVHQMTSTIQSTVRSGCTLLDLFRSVFPCGSVTGTPKIASTRFIVDLERAPRGVYCGAIGYVEPGGDAVFNVPIRTVVVDRERGEAEYGVGGGITWDSSAEDEYAEVLTKAEILKAEWPAFSLLETFRSDGRSAIRLEAHLERMATSAAFFGFPFSRFSVEAAVEQALTEEGIWRVRVLWDVDGRVSVEVLPSDPVAPSTEPPPAVELSKRPVSSRDPFLFHKTTHRSVYESRAAEHPDAFDVLLVNENGFITEFTRGNVVAEMEGVAYTPPRACGLLAGVFRGALLEKGEIQERRLTTDQIIGASRLWLINSVREWVEVRLVE